MICAAAGRRALAALPYHSPEGNRRGRGGRAGRRARLAGLRHRLDLAGPSSPRPPGSRRRARNLLHRARDRLGRDRNLLPQALGVVAPRPHAAPRRPTTAAPRRWRERAPAQHLREDFDHRRERVGDDQRHEERSEERSAQYSMEIEAMIARDRGARSPKLFMEAPVWNHDILAVPRDAAVRRGPGPYV